ncbi:hypothetical protein [Yoonia sp. 2307UL14-13]|uniref:hypothetical protein n=1 Tax=Yoonia sp. 2307UL14-13 TaxID=3126506 RepID=UPI0030AC5ECA
MDRPGNFHSKLVGWSKILLPMAALGLLSTLFLFSRQSAAPPEIPFAEIEAIARDQRISAPRFSGVADDGSVIAIAARQAKPDITRPDILTIKEITARIDRADGSNLDITATSGEVDGTEEIARFIGLARLTTSSGYEMETNGLIAELRTGVVTSNGLLEIHAPFGELTAGQVTFQVAGDDTGQQMLFSQGVRLIYRPQN